MEGVVTPYSVKPGRGPSVLSGVFAIVFGLFSFFLVADVSANGAPGAFVAMAYLIGVFAIVGGIYQLYNAGARNRMSALDITTGGEEPDPISEAIGRRSEAPKHAGATPQAGANFCPHCGTQLGPDFKFCPSCGKRI
jgi:hypothetical protein